MSTTAIIVMIVVVLTTSVITINSLDKYKRRVARDVCAYLGDLIGVLHGIGLNKDLLDRYERPDILTKIKVINVLMGRCDEKMNIFVELNKHVKFISDDKAKALTHSYKLNTDRIRMSLNSLTRAIDLYGIKSERVYSLVKRYDRVIVLSSDGLSGILLTLNNTLTDYK